MAVESPSAWTRLMDDARARVAEGAPLETRGTLTRQAVMFKVVALGR